MEFCGIDRFEDLITQQNKIITYLMLLIEKKLSCNSISTRLNAIYHSTTWTTFLYKKKIRCSKENTQEK